MLKNQQQQSPSQTQNQSPAAEDTPSFGKKTLGKAKKGQIKSFSVDAHLDQMGNLTPNGATLMNDTVLIVTLADSAIVPFAYSDV